MQTGKEWVCKQWYNFEKWIILHGVYSNQFFPRILVERLSYRRSSATLMTRTQQIIQVDKMWRCGKGLDAF